MLLFKMPAFGIATALVGFLVWALWCVLVVTEVVPALRVHVGFWPWMMAWLLSLLPVLIVAAVILIKTKPKDQ